MTQTLSEITVEKPTQEKLESVQAFTWPVWTKEPSTFDWEYEDREMCYFLEGDVTVKTADGEIRMGKGDLVTFPKGLKCVWTVHQAVRKHYQFG